VQRQASHEASAICPMPIEHALASEAGKNDAAHKHGSHRGHWSARANTNATDRPRQASARADQALWWE